MSDGHEIIIVKRHSAHEEEHHGGAWKIAFADFMTAMMAFFLVLWIINATDKDTKTIIARYFNPVKLEDTAKAPKGIRDSVHKKVKGDVSENDAKSEGEPDSTDDDTKQDASTETAAGAEPKQAAHKDKGGRQGVKLADAAEAGTANIADPAKPKPTISESALFKDPYASLDEIAGKPAPPWSVKPQSIGRNDPITNAGTMDTDAFRDPFQPIARAPGDGTGSGGDVKTETSPAFDRIGPGDRIAAGPVSPHGAQGGERPDKNAGSQPSPTSSPPSSASPAIGVEALKPTEPKPQNPASTSAAVQAASVSETSANASSNATVMSLPPGTGAQPPANTETSKASAPEAQPKTAATEAQAKAGAGEVSQIRSELLKEIGGTEGFQPGPGLEVQMTDEGLLISLTDQFNFSMFPIGSAEPQARVVHIMEKIAQALKSRPGVVVVRGFTDARPYRSATYDNWRLSSARAQMAYYMLVRGGMPEKRFDRIEGYADRRPRTPANPLAAENRRIEILLRRAKT
jgi:chemotaxis protein MotB